MDRPNNNRNDKNYRSTDILILASIVILLAFIAALIIWPQAYHVFHEYDINILKSINLNRIKQLDPVFLLLTNTSSLVCIIVTLVTLVTGLVKRSTLLQLKGAQLLLTFLSSFIVIKLLKYLIGRERPYISYQFLEKIAQAESLSFPSGHTFEAFAFATAVTLVFRNRLAAVTVLFWASMVALSRLILGMHYLTDVLGGFGLGIFHGYVVHVLYRKNTGL